ncbi:NERD domain-containing protein [Fictibacillus nanhaiensis]|uniref:nuclease-related domain-containing protein n=1 Tax=Fictibacillus nanhaiensis TaxID=742169 RepID=UPI001C962443|nr:nuclease-related domain-containing protein [Fictibacillus nanhaiensis]MBY6038140.1 NERD domain-containing protein [Fictibacillus nanhaiensis]
MIRKARSKPIKLLKLEVLLERMVPNHTKKQQIVGDFVKVNAGFKGEMSLDFHLTDLLNDHYDIFQDLRLPRDKNKDLFFQIDSLIVHSRFCVLLEVKNLIGNLYFDHQFDQIIRTRDGVDETFPDPINQVELQAKYFAEWLAAHKLPSVPLYTLVVITNQKSYIRTSSKYGKKAQKIIRGNNLAKKINNYEKLHEEALLLNKERNKLSSLLNKQHTPHNPDILKSYHINTGDILTGVSCPSCNTIPMVRIKRNWFCKHCSTKSMNAHVKALQDYALLFDPIAKNKDIREFLHIESRSSAKKLLSAMNLTPTGLRKSATYTLPIPK